MQEDEHDFDLLALDAALRISSSQPIKAQLTCKKLIPWTPHFLIPAPKAQLTWKERWYLGRSISSSQPSLPGRSWCVLEVLSLIITCLCVCTCVCVCVCVCL